MNALAVYVHIPFCTVKCGYCDFNAYAGMDALEDRYRDAVLAEVAGYGADLARHTVTSISFGGGTPGEVPAGHIADMIRAIASAAPLAGDLEISLEANPGTVTLGQLQELVAAGVSRLSLGGQSFDAAQLKFLDRIHSPEAIAAAVALARDAGFTSVNLDLLYGIPEQDEDSWRHSLELALAAGVDHLSLYALTVEEETPLARRVADGSVVMPDSDFLADQYDLATDLLDHAGFVQYEISNWARPGHESRHNQTYWRYGEYLGLGAGAHGFFEEVRYENIAHPRRYIESLTGPHPAGAVANSYRPDVRMAIGDWLALRLRMLDGFHRAEFRLQFGVDLDLVAGEPLAPALQAGLLDYTGGRLALSRRGRLLHSEIIARVLAHLDRHPDIVDRVRMAARC